MMSVLSSFSCGLAALGAIVSTPQEGQFDLRSLLSVSVKPVPAAMASKPSEPGFNLLDVAPRKPSKGDVLCSLESSDLELPMILKLLSEQSKTNLILLGASDHKLTVRLKNVPLSEMLGHLCALTNLSYIEVGSTFVVAPESTLKERYSKEWKAVHPDVTPATEAPAEAPIVTRVYRGSYFDASRVAEAISKMFGEGKIFVAGAPTQLSPQMGERDTFAATGVTQGTLRSSSDSGRSGKELILRGPENLVEAAIEVAKQLDQPRAQVSIAVTIHDISNDALKQLGLTWEYGNLTLQEVDPKGINFGSFTRAPVSVVGTIRALEKNDRAKLLASPNISVIDGESAFILIGNRLNFPVLVGFSQANTPIFDKQEERVGIYMQVSALVSEDNQITLSLYPQVSTVTGFLEVNGASYPQISTREAQTTLRVASGESIVMGGMLKDEELSSIERIPLLSQIPFLGELFTHRKKTKSSSQVVITITPTVISSGKQ